MFIGVIVVLCLFICIYVLPPQFLRNRLENALGLTKSREKKYERILQDEPNQLQARLFLGALRTKEQNYREAYNHYSHLLVALRTTPELRSKLNSFEIYLNFGIAAYHEDKKSEALTSLQKARLHLNRSECFDLFYYLGMLYYEHKDYREACSSLQQTLKQKKNDKEIAFCLAISYFKTKDYKSAYPLLKALTEAGPQDSSAETNYYFGLCLAHMKHYDEAVAQLEKASEDPSLMLPSQYQTVKIYLKEGLPNKALEMCMKIIGTNFADSPKELHFAYLQGSKILAARGDLKQAIPLLESLLAIEPEHPNALKLHKRYQKGLNAPQLFKLLECNDEMRTGLAKKLVSLLLSGSEDIQVINMEQQNIELRAKKKDVNYYLWINLQDVEINIRQVFRAHVNAKQQHCSHCIMAALSSFERDVQVYIEGREIYLIQGAELRKLIKLTA